ncbi:hypothetical protein IFM89_005647, partial [Coptis chinensis]
VFGTLEGVSELMFRKGLMLKEIFLKNNRYQLKAWIRDDTESALITIFGDEAKELLKHLASELEKLIESENGIQTVKAIIDEIIGSSIVFEIKISQYNIQSQGRYGFTTNKVFQVDYKLDSHRIEEQIEQVIEASQILNDTFRAHPPHNIHKNDSTPMKEKVATVTEFLEKVTITHVLDKMQYLHAALSEALRLHHPVPTKNIVQRGGSTKMAGATLRPFKFTAFQSDANVSLERICLLKMKVFTSIMLNLFGFKLWEKKKPINYQTMITLHIDGPLKLRASPKV